MRRTAAGTALVLAVVLLPAVVRAPWAQAQTFSVLYTLSGADGENPYAGLVRDAKGNLYGTTNQGGDPACEISGCGTAFKLDTARKLTVLHTFKGVADGANPIAGLVRDEAGNLYGTTEAGGGGNCNGGCGTVFKLNKTGRETVLHRFRGGRDGANPIAGLIRDAAGNLYGTTLRGGLSGCSSYDSCGTVFRLDRTGRETVLYRFTGGADGSTPVAGLLRDATGSLYGTTYLGGSNNAGTVFELDATGRETVLYTFTGGSDGALPGAGLVRDKAGNFYSTTASGGSSGHGAVFRLDTTGKQTVLYSFTGGSDGGTPYAGLVQDKAGSFYGTTFEGGQGPYYYGVVFKVDRSGEDSVLYTSTGGSDGGYPYAGLVRDAAGDLYGATVGGPGTNGTVFRVTP